MRVDGKKHRDTRAEERTLGWQGDMLRVSYKIGETQGEQALLHREDESRRASSGIEHT